LRGKSRKREAEGVGGVVRQRKRGEGRGGQDGSQHDVRPAKRTTGNEKKRGEKKGRV